MKAARVRGPPSASAVSRVRARILDPSGLDTACLTVANLDGSGLDEAYDGVHFLALATESDQSPSL